MAKEFYRQFAKRLRELRIQANLSQEEFAERVGVATKTVSYWENAHNPVTFSKIPIIADVLNIPVYKLFIFVQENEKLADKEYIELLQSKTGKELETLFALVQELQKIK